MLKTGEFSKLSRVSVRMLRHYDEIGLLKPAEIDRFTDYRYYREDQLPTAGRIAALKDIGFSLADIVRVLEVYDDREQMEKFFSARQKELETLSQDTAHKLTLLDAARKRLRKEENMSYNVTLKHTNSMNQRKGCHPLIGDGPPFHLFRSYPIRQTALGLHLNLRLKMYQITARSLDYQRFEPGIFFGRTCHLVRPKKMSRRKP